MNKKVTGSLFDKDPLLGQAIGIAPLVLFSSTAVSGLIYGICSFVVLLLTAFVVSSIKKVVPRGATLLIFVAVSACLCVLTEALARFVLGFFDGSVLWMLPFLFCNSLYVYRASDVYVQAPVQKSIVDALRVGGLSFCVIVVLSVFREVTSLGSVFGITLFPAEKACTFLGLPAGGLLLFGFICGLYRFIRLQSGTEAQEK